MLLSNKNPVVCEGHKVNKETAQLAKINFIQSSPSIHRGLIPGPPMDTPQMLKSLV